MPSYAVTTLESDDKFRTVILGPSNYYSRGITGNPTAEVPDLVNTLGVTVFSTCEPV
jgi:hypothetical protein